MWADVKKEGRTDGQTYGSDRHTDRLTDRQTYSSDRHTDGKTYRWTDIEFRQKYRRTDMTKLIVAFRNFWNAPKNINFPTNSIKQGHI